MSKKIIVLIVIAFLFVSCARTTVKMEAPDKPIVINLNVKIEHEIRVKVEKELDQVLNEESGLF